MPILSTILLRLWIVLAIPPHRSELLMAAIVLIGYCFIAFFWGWRWRLIDLEPIRVWWILQLYRYRLQLYNNRQAAKLMALLWVWVTIEELLLRVMLVPLSVEQLPIYQRALWIAGAGLLAIARYIFLYCRLHPYFGQLRFLLLAGLLDLACLMAYVLTEFLWLIIVFHWLVLVSWLLLLGGRYQLRQYKIVQLADRKY